MIFILIHHIFKVILKKNTRYNVISVKNRKYIEDKYSCELFGHSSALGIYFKSINITTDIDL